MKEAFSLWGIVDVECGWKKAGIVEDGRKWLQPGGDCEASEPEISMLRPHSLQRF